VSHIDKTGIERAVCRLLKDSLAIIGVLTADIEEPGEPERNTVADPHITVSGKDFQETPSLGT
jgi:hypothetical protein